MHPRTWRATLVATAVATVLLVSPQAVAAPPGPAAPAPDGAVAPAMAAQPEGMVAAVSRDLGVDVTRARQLLAGAETAARVEQELRSALGHRFGGAWMAGDQLAVGITDQTLAQRVRAAGAEPRPVHHSLAELEQAVRRLDRAGAPPEVTGWYVDVRANAVVVEVLPGARAAAADFVERSGVGEVPVRIAPVASAPVPMQRTLREGDPVLIGNARCTVGFLVRTAAAENGFLTAGHCGPVGTPVFGANGEVIGTVAVSIFPGLDTGLVVVEDDLAPTPVAAGSMAAPVGAAVCMTSPITGVHCGSITARNQTVQLPQGTIVGLLRTNVCGAPGQSGAPLFAAGQQGQGTLSVASGSCTFGGTTFFQPLNPVLMGLGLTLITA